MLHRKLYGNCRSDGNRKVAFGDLYLMISTAAWKSLRKKRSAFSTVPTALTTARPSEIRGTKHNISFTPLVSAHQDVVQRLAEVPGLGVDSAQQIVAEVGPAAAAFPSPKHLASWGGCLPWRGR